MKRSHGASNVILFSLSTLLVAGLFALATMPAAAADAAEQQALVDNARITVGNFLVDPDLGWFRNHVKDVKGLLIVPALYKAGFVFGGSGGRGVLLVRDEKTGEWSEPAFYTIGSVSFGLQIGAKKSEVIMMVMTRKGLESLFASTIKLGGEISVAAGPVGASAEAATTPTLSADYLSFARAKGAFGGFSLEGAVVKTNDVWNMAYYGESVRPVDIFVKRDVSNAQSAGLRAVLTKATKKP